MMLSTKMLIVCLLKILWNKVLSNKGYDAIISVHGVTNEILSRESNYVIDGVTRPKLGNSSISVRQGITTSIFIKIWPEKPLFLWGGCSWFKSNNLGLALGIAKGLKLKVRKFWWANSNVCRSYRGKIGRMEGGGGFLPHILNRFNVIEVKHFLIMDIFLTRHNWWDFSGFNAIKL